MTNMVRVLFHHPQARTVFAEWPTLLDRRTRGEPDGTPLTRGGPQPPESATAAVTTRKTAPTPAKTTAMTVPPAQKPSRRMRVGLAGS